MPQKIFHNGLKESHNIFFGLSRNWCENSGSNNSQGQKEKRLNQLTSILSEIITKPYFYDDFKWNRSQLTRYRLTSRNIIGEIGDDPSRILTFFFKCKNQPLGHQLKIRIF